MKPIYFSMTPAFSLHRLNQTLQTFCIFPISNPLVTAFLFYLCQPKSYLFIKNQLACYILYEFTPVPAIKQKIVSFGVLMIFCNLVQQLLHLFSSNFHIFLLVCGCIKAGLKLLIQLQMILNFSDSLASTTQMLGLQVCSTMSSYAYSNSSTKM